MFDLQLLWRCIKWSSRRRPEVSAQWRCSCSGCMRPTHPWDASSNMEAESWTNCTPTRATAHLKRFATGSLRADSKSANHNEMTWKIFLKFEFLYKIIKKDVENAEINVIMSFGVPNKQKETPSSKKNDVKSI